MSDLYWSSFPLVDKMKMIRLERSPGRLQQLGAFTMIAGFASSYRISPSSFSAFCSGYDMIQSEFLVLKYFQTVLTLIHVAQIHIASAELGALFEAEVFFGHTDTGHFHLEFFAVDSPILVFFENRNPTQKMQFDGMLPTNNT